MLSTLRQRQVIAAAYEYNSLEWVFSEVKHICFNTQMSEPDKATMQTIPFALNAFTCTMKFSKHKQPRHVALKVNKCVVNLLLLWTLFSCSLLAPLNAMRLWTGRNTALYTLE